MILAGVIPNIDSPLKITSPDCALYSPAMSSHSSFCPLPAMPATPKISPVFSVKDIRRITSRPSAFWAVRFFTSSNGRWFSLSTGTRSMSRLTARPTIISVSWRGSVSLVFTVPMVSPLRSTVTRSLISITSFILWVMMIMLHPSCFILRRMSNSFVISCGVNTAVGSSKIRIFAPRYSTFKISTVCFSLTDML